MALFDVDSLSGQLSASGKSYLEFPREASMSMGLYELKAGETDGQTPHSEDETYLVLKGRAKFTLEGDQFDVEPGSVIYVPARSEHRFHSIVEDLSVLVFFAPAEHSNKSEQGMVDATG